MSPCLSVAASVLTLVLSSVSPLAAVQQDSSDAHTVIIVDSLTRAAFANVPELLQARAPGFHIARNGDGGMRWFMRGPSSISESTPLVLVDDMRINMAGSAMRDIGTRPALLDDIDVEDVERIEIWRGPARAVQEGTGAGNGVIRVVTFAPRAQPMSFRVVTSASTLDETVGYPTNAFRVGVETGGRPIRFCTLQAEATDRCTPTGPLGLVNALESDSPFETAVGARVATTIAAGTNRLAGRGGASFDREGSTSGTLAAQRVRLRGAATFRPGDDIGATLRGHWMRGSADLRALDEPSLLEQGLLARADTAWTGFAQPPSSRYNSVRYGVTANGQWRPRGWLQARLTSGVERVTDENDLEYLSSSGVFARSTIDARGEQRRRDLTIRLDAEADYGTGAMRHATGLTIERVVSKQEEEFSELASHPNGLSDSRAFWINQRTGIAGIGLLHRLRFADVATLAAGVRLDQVRINDRRWDVPLSPHLSLSWDARRFVPGGLGGVKLRASLADVANVPQTTRMSFTFNPGDPERPKAEVTRERELGVDAMMAHDRIGVSLTWYTKRTSNALNLIVAPSPGFPSFPSFERYEVLNRGIETSVRARIVQTPRLTWDVRASYAHNHNEVTRGFPILITLGESGPNRQWVMPGQPIAAHSSSPIISVRDLDGDGLVDDTCHEPSTCEAIVSNALEFRPAYPPTTAGLETSFRFGALTLSALIDHRSGHVVNNLTATIRCLFQCRALYDPSTSLRDQAAAMLAPSTSTGTMVQDASFTKLREVSVRIEAPAAWARALGASRVGVSLAGRNIATWTDYSGLDPEATSVPWIPLANMDFAATPLPRRLVIRAELHGR